MTDPLTIDSVETDILVLGAGGAGLCAALHAADRSASLAIGVAVKGLLGRAGCTRMVQGGYNAVLTPPDSIDAHFLDTLEGGAWINDQELAWTLVNEAPGRVLELEARYGCFFDRHPNGQVHQKPFAGQRHDRTIHKGDLTGIEIMNRLTEQVWRRPSISAFEEHRALDLLRDDGGRVSGALLLDLRRGTLVAVSSRATLLAMGGGPTMYRVIACSADKAADGIAIGFRAGLRLRDMEMVQFHPTGLIVPNSLMTGALLEEGLRGAGGRLLNGRGERFMERYDPKRMERSTRDLVARACFTEVIEGRGTPHGGVWIDVSHLGAEVVERSFRGMVKRCRDFGYDLARTPVEVGPTTHFMMGGIAIDSACHTDLEGLFAAGEDTGGVHGANRLGGNGVAESTVFGGIAGDVMAADLAAGAPRHAPDEDILQAELALAQHPFTQKGGDLNRVRETLLDAMWDDVGVIRDAAGLQRALAKLESIEAELLSAGVPDGDRAFNLTWQDWLNLRSLIEISKVIALAALRRENSRGAHYREDFPGEGDLAASTFTVARQRGGALDISDEPVQFTHVRPGQSLLKEAAE
jgi:fumarate reductase flavoprotein subunit